MSFSILLSLVRLKVKPLFLVFIIPFVFLVVGILTLDDYGISWDEPIHFHRGQAYLEYMLTGNVKFEKDKIHSYYQNNELPAEYFLEKDDGHPPLNGILASILNKIFYQNLKWLGDIEAYHLFNILTSTLLVLIVVLFARETYGYFAAIVSGLVVSTYPLFFAESHFNIKDPAQTAFFTLTIWAIWKSLSGSKYWIIISAVGFGAALGTKFNILFSPLIIIPYLIVRYKNYFNSGVLKLTTRLVQTLKSYLLIFITSIIIVFLIVFGTWPFLWQDPLANIIFILKWYKDIGTGQASFGYFTYGGVNLFAPFWILITSPPFVLCLVAVGIITSIKRRNEKNWVSLLWLLWFFVPIIRVMLPNTTIYGGVRQIMEYLPAMALLSGFGAFKIIEWVDSKSNYKKLSQIILLLLFIPQVYVLVKLHPNQNVYFNSLIGGLSGAKSFGVPYWGNSLGNAYLQAVDWLNSNAKSQEKVALVQGTSVNIPRITIRNDIAFSNSYWSGIYRDGEYLIELTHNDLKFYPYAWEYIEKFLIPVYEVKVDGVAIAKVWKNDKAHTKEEYRKSEIVFNDSIVKTLNNQEVVLDLGSPLTLTRLIIYYNEDNCQKANAHISTSLDRLEWIDESEDIPVDQVYYREESKKHLDPFFFPGRLARFIKIKDHSINSCLLEEKVNYKVYRLGELL